MAHQAGAYPGFRSMKGLGVFLLPPGWDASLSLLPMNTTQCPQLRSRTPTARPGVEHTNHEATAPSTSSTPYSTGPQASGLECVFRQKTNRLEFQPNFQIFS